MKYEGKILEQLGDWSIWFKSFIEGKGLGKIYSFLKGEVGKKKEVLPISSSVFRSFALCPRDSVKCVVFMMDPYPTKSKEGVIISDGVPMSCKNTGKLQPSLEFWYQKIEEQYGGFNVNMDYRYDCSYLLKEEGVLLLNSSLTVEMQKPGSHSEIWLPFMQYFIEEILNIYYRGLPIVMCGEKAQRLEKFINPLIHRIHKTSHPASVAHSGGSFWSTDMFTFIDKIIEANNGPESRIRWWRNKEESDMPLPEWITKSSYSKSKINENETIGDLTWQKKK